MAEFPSITHVALTVSDLDRSVPWYGTLFGTQPVIDEDTGPFRHVVWLVGQTLVVPNRSTSGGSVWITWRFLAPTARNWRSGRRA
jgi:catechol 2,3-dioxygenase-like lactoylglutathione lyase family enzyme